MKNKVVERIIKATVGVFGSAAGFIGGCVLGYHALMSILWGDMKDVTWLHEVIGGLGRVWWGSSRRHCFL